MKVELRDEDIKIIEKAEKIVGYLERNGNYVNLDDLIGIIDNLVYEANRLEEKIEDLNKDIEDNYEPRKFDPYEEYGVSESMFH